MADQVHWYLECRKPEKNTSKFYEVQLVKELGDRYTIQVHHGRIGKKPRPFTPNKGLTYSVAKNQALSLVESKLAKGYVEVQKKAPATEEKKQAPQPEGRFSRLDFGDQ